MLQGIKETLRSLVGGSTAGPPSQATLFHWSPRDHRGKENFGDALSRVIVEHALAELGGPALTTETGRRGRREKRLLAIGSILHLARPGDVIWGTGVNGKTLGQIPPLRRLDIRMVRGPLTRDHILAHGGSCPATWGEPGLLLPRYITPRDSPSGDLVIVPNLNDMRFYRGIEGVVNPTDPWPTVVEKIFNADFVISSSLHGLVVADAYGVPARPLLSFAEPVFKYRDYYEGTGRRDVVFAHTVTDAVRLGPTRPPRFSAEEMLELFPLDIF